MAKNAEFTNIIDEKGVVACLQRAAEQLDGGECTATLDFSCVRTIDSVGLRALEEFVRVADERDGKVVLRGVNIDVYKVLKLVKLTRRFSFVN